MASQAEPLTRELQLPFSQMGLLSSRVIDFNARHSRLYYCTVPPLTAINTVPLAIQSDDQVCWQVRLFDFFQMKYIPTLW